MSPIANVVRGVDPGYRCCLSICGSLCGTMVRTLRREIQKDRYSTAEFEQGVAIENTDARTQLIAGDRDELVNHEPTWRTKSIFWSRKTGMRMIGACASAEVKRQRITDPRLLK
jgi:hypothetical protein